MGIVEDEMDRVPSHIASIQDAKSRDEAIDLMRKFIEEGINSGPSVDGPEALKRLKAKLATKYQAAS